MFSTALSLHIDDLPAPTQIYAQHIIWSTSWSYSLSKWRRWNKTIGKRSGSYKG